MKHALQAMVILISPNFFRGKVYIIFSVTKSLHNSLVKKILVVIMKGLKTVQGP